MLTLAAWLNSQDDLTPAEFARRLGARLGRQVSNQNVFRWTRDTRHPDFSIPEPDTVVAIYFETDKQVTVESWYGHLVSAVAAKTTKARAAARARARARKAA